VKKTNLLLALAALSLSSFAKDETNNRDLSKYKITGNLAHAFDTNKGLIYDERNPVLNFCFEDEKGNKALANFQCHMKTVGNILNLSCKYYFARFIGASFSLKDVQDRSIDLGMGACIDRPIPIKGTKPFIINGQPVTDNNGTTIMIPKHPLLIFVGLGAHISKLKNRDGAFVLAAPTLGISGGLLKWFEGLGVVVGGDLTMIGQPVFEDAPESSDPTGTQDSVEAEPAVKAIPKIENAA
jgi:hypothetical protein